ncbi:MAG: hypothetical protein FJY77_02845, partial [Candidatus Altiarchaeales archaeon]|nr:hypothetical protein [Candidatus Altiarchaeales archaeon]
MSKKLQLGKMRLKQAISICLLIACCLILTTSASAQGCDSEYIANANPVCQLDDCENYCMDWLPQGDLDCQTRPGYTETARCCDDSPNPDITQRCSKGCIGGVNPTCQPADCGVYCMQERSEGNADCQNRPDFHVPDEDGVPQQQRAKCCDVAPCSAALGGVCEHSITIDPADPNHDGGECIYLNSEDRTDFFCPMGWTHVAIGDQDCAAKKQNTGGEYQGTITDSMCCCAPMIDSCNRLTPTGYKPDYVYGSRGDADILEDMSKPWYAVVSISKYGELSFRKSYGFNIEYDKPITDTEAGDQCVPTQPGTMGGLGPGQGDCDGNCDLTGNQACAEGLVCSDDAPGRKDYCCPAGQTKYYHSTKKCCTSAPPFIPIGATPKSCTSNSQCTGGRKCILVEGEGYCVAAYPGSCSSDSYCATEVSSIFTLCRASIDGTKYCFVANADCSSCDSTPTPDGHLQKCMGDCDRNPNAACDDDECEPGLTCTSDHCCPPGTSWDNTKNQCCYANSINSENYNGFIRIVNACNNGTVECGWIKRYGPGNYGIVFSEQYCDENNPQNVGPQRTALNYSYIPQCMRSGEEDEPRRFTVLMKVDRVYADNNTARLSPQFENLTVVPGVYRVIAVNDSDLISLKRRIALEYENARRSNTPISTPNTEAYYDYCTTYILARGCDMPFGINVTNMCKNLRMEGGGLKENYTYQVENMNFSACMWEIIDGGKYYDFPGVYLTVMNKSRHGANLGLMYYYVNSLEPRGTTHMVNPSGTPGGQEANVRWLLNWNKKSAGRILGCRSDSNEFWSDTCSPGDFTCSLGAALANAYTQGFRADKIKSNLSKKCGYFEHEQPKTSNVPGQTADYFQYNDLDDENKEDDPFDVGEVYDDKSFDFELGVPDRKYLVNQSIESIKTEISALFVDHSSVRWKGIYYREALTFYSQCRPGTDTSKKYFKIPYGRGSYSGGQWVNGPWYGGTMYQYIYKNGFFNYTTYPAKTDVQFWPFSGWPDRETCNNPVIFYNNERLTNYDTPAATDRYWIINPKEQATSRPDLQCTRPAHSGNLGGSSEPLYYTNPGGYNAPGDKPRVDPFNEGGTSDLLKYYRQYNKRTLWANVFKVTPEFHNRPPEDDLCAPETESTNGGIGAGQGDCDGSCSNKLCEQGLVCADVPWSTTEYCCPEA